MISGPFPIGTAENDQISYGYDLTVRPFSFNTKLAMVLVELALRPNRNRPEKLTPPIIVIAHPDSSAAREGAAAIARMWIDIGVPASTRELRPGLSVPDDEEWDFLYMEVTMEEPLADAARIIGSTGIAPAVAPVDQTMRRTSAMLKVGVRRALLAATASAGFGRSVAHSLVAAERTLCLSQYGSRRGPRPDSPLPECRSLANRFRPYLTKKNRR